MASGEVINVLIVAGRLRQASPDGDRRRHDASRGTETRVRRVLTCTLFKGMQYPLLCVGWLRERRNSNFEQHAACSSRSNGPDLEQQDAYRYVDGGEVHTLARGTSNVAPPWSPA